MYYHLRSTENDTITPSPHHSVLQRANRCCGPFVVAWPNPFCSCSFCYKICKPEFPWICSIFHLYKLHFSKVFINKIAFKFENIAGIILHMGMFCDDVWLFFEWLSGWILIALLSKNSNPAPFLKVVPVQTSLFLATPIKSFFRRRRLRNLFFHFSEF